MERPSKTGLCSGSLREVWLREQPRKGQKAVCPVCQKEMTGRIEMPGGRRSRGVVIPKHGRPLK